MPSQVSGLAASIRNAVESETFDLGGQTAATIERTISDAFGNGNSGAYEFPQIARGSMIRLTFVTGAGKLGRAKYDDGAAKAVTSTLRSLGYEEDRGASAVWECAGSFKQQHDTGKNLKTVVVFPMVATTTNDGGDSINAAMGGMSLGVNNNASSGTPLDALLSEETPEHMLAHSSASVFARMMDSKCASWSQKKGCLAALETIKSNVQNLEEKLMTGTPLSDSEQTIYDAVSLTSLQEKQAVVKDLMQKQVEEGTGDLTAAEKDTLLNQVSGRIEALESDLATAQERDQAKSTPKTRQRLEKLGLTLQKAEERRTMLGSRKPQPPRRLKNGPAITKLRTELAPLLKVETKKRQLLSLKETQAIARKEEIENEIAQLEESSRGWFENDDAFAERVEYSRKLYKGTSKSKGAGTKGGGSRVSSGSSVSRITSTNWSTPGPSRNNKRPKAKAKSGGGTGVFAAMMMDSDSD